MDMVTLSGLAKLIRYYILISTTAAGSGHPTSSLSATDLMTALMFGGHFKTRLDEPEYCNNDRLIFSKGHASPLFYALYGAAGKLSEAELLTLRKFGSPLEGHPTMKFPFTEAATGSLGQGLSIGVGMAMNAKFLDKLSYKTYVLLGDSEMAEGSVWEAMMSASYYKLDNLIAIVDVNRLGQRGQTMYGHNVNIYEERAKSFGWETIVVDGHSLEEIMTVFQRASLMAGKPVMIIAKTLKGSGISFIEDKDNFHGKPLSREDLEKALLELGEIDKDLRGNVAEPDNSKLEKLPIGTVEKMKYERGQLVATRRAYGNALVRLYAKYPEIVVLDAEVGNSTYSEFFLKSNPDRYFDLFIAEQNMVGVAQGLARRGKKPFIATFAAFFSRAFDQIRMSQYSESNITFVGSHVGVSIGADGSSQMGLEDIATFRTISNGVVLYPSDAVSTEKLVEEAAKRNGVAYLRTTRADTPVIYSPDEEFPIGGSKLLRHSENDVVTVVTAGITLHEAVSAADELATENIMVRVVDLYSVKPIDQETLIKAARETKAIITVEDHYPEGGLGEAVMSALAENSLPIYSLAVRKMPQSGEPDELMAFEDIDKDAIIKKIRQII